GDVLLVAADRVTYDGTYPIVDSMSEVYEILVSREKISGKVTEKNTDYVTVEDNKFSVSSGLEYAILKSEASDLNVDFEAEFLIDYFGEIAGYDKAGNLPVNGKYGYIVDGWVGEDSDGEEMAILKLFDFGIKSTELVYCADTVNIDGSRYKYGTQQLNALKRQYSGDYTTDVAPRLIIYKLNEDGKIIFIDTDYISATENSDTSLIFDENQQTDMYSSMVFGGNIGVGENTIILAVPKARAASNATQTFPGSVRTYICNKTMEDFIYFRSSFSSNSTKYTVESYNMKENGEAEVIVFYYTPVTKSGIISSETEKNMMVESVAQVVIGDEVGYEIRGFCNSSFNVLYINEDECVVADVAMDNEGNVSSTEISPMELKTGDIVRCSNIKQNTNLTIRVERVVKSSEAFVPNMKYYTQANEDSALIRSEYFNAFNVSCGNVISCKNGIAKVDFGESSKVYNLNNVTVCVYDKADKTIYETDTIEIMPGSEMILVTSDGVVRACYLYR
ncbi:MAG: hypothetical protein IJ300_06150, partial [Clostridia bacterium]|nr:hypothetical protein [Clostridia bacterium]